MAQYDFGTIDPNTKSGTALATDLNSWRSALHSTHSGSTAPSYLVPAMLWADTTSANYELKMYDGAQWIPIAVIDATNNVVRTALDGPETSYITATTAAQIKHVIANVDTMTVRSTGVQFNIASPVIGDSSNNELLSFSTTASAVNQIAIANAATGNGPVIGALGDDTNIPIIITGKGTGTIRNLVTSAATNTVIDVTRIQAESSGTPAVGIGTGLLFATETAAGNVEIGARIEAITTDVTNNSEDFDLSFKLMTNGAAAAEVMRIKSTGVLEVGGVPLTAGGFTLLGTITTTSGTSQSLSSLTLTGYQYLVFDFNGVNASGGGADRKVGGVQMSITNSGAFYGQVFVSLATGRAWGALAADTTTSSVYVGNTSYSTATTSVSVSTGGTAFNAGSVRVYGVK